jgi:bifunctional non-homologous end joining protein LigD
VTSARVEVEVAGRRLELSNRDKVFWPETGFTKGDLLDYYEAVAPTMVAHLAGRPITLRRWPDGVDGQSFFQKNAPKHRPGWMATVRLGDVDYLRIDEPAGLLWAANSAAIEIHPGLAGAPHLDTPGWLVLDLDPGDGADVMTCRQVALILRDYLARLQLVAWPKTSGSKGLQLYVPLNNGTRYDTTRPFAEALAHMAEADHPDLIVSSIDRSVRRKKVLIDWNQNAASRTTVAAYSVRALPRPSVSTPLSWDELEGASAADDLRFDTSAVLQRLGQLGDLMAPVLSVEQELPAVRS